MLLCYQRVLKVNTRVKDIDHLPARAASTKHNSTLWKERQNFYIFAKFLSVVYHCLPLENIIFFFQTSMNVWARRAHAKGGRCALTQLAPTYARGTQSTAVEDITSTRRERAVSVKASKKSLHNKTNPINKPLFHLVHGLASFRRYRRV